MSTINGLGGVNRGWDSSQSGESRRAAHEARLFAKVDSDSSGSVDATELGSMLASMGADSSGDGVELLKTMDGDGDGSLTSDELSQGLRELMPPPASTVDFAQSRGTTKAANDEGDAFTALDADADGQLARAEFDAGRPAPPAGGMPPPAASPATAASGTGSTASTSTTYDPLDVNQDGTVTELERLAGELKQLAQAAGGSGTQGMDPEIAALAQKLYDQISRNWLQPAADPAVNVSA